MHIIIRRQNFNTFSIKKITENELKFICERKFPNEVIIILDN